MRLRPGFTRLWQGSLRRQLILAVAGVHALLMSLFIWDVTGRQRTQLLELQDEQAQAMVHAMATSSAGWLAARDVAGLQELVEAQRRYPELIFAMLLDQQGLILAHTEHARVGQYVLDLPSAGTSAKLSRTPRLVDVVTPVMLSGRQVGWVRVGIGQRAAGDQLAHNTRDGIIYALAAIGIGAIFAALLGTRLTAKLYAIRRVSAAVRSGQRDARVPELGSDEAGRLGADFNDMLRALETRETALRESEEKYRTLIQKLQTAVVVHAADTHIITCNPVAQTLLGLSEAQMLSKTAVDPHWHFSCVDGTPLPLDEYPVNKVLATRQPLRNAVMGVHRPGDDSDLWVMVNANPVAGQDGAVAEIIVTFTDITERKRAEEALQESEQRFRQVTETIDEVFWLTDPAKEKMIYISPAYQRVWGRTCASLYAEPGTWLAAVHPEDRKRAGEAMRTQLATGTYDVEYRILRPDGEVRWIHDRAFPIKDTGGQTCRIAGVAEDITERRKLERQFLHAQRMEAIGTLAGGVAHDLNNILAPMLMAAGMLKDKLVSPKDRELMNMIERSALRGSGIIRQLLTFGQGIEGARVLVQPRHLIREMMQFMQETFPRTLILEDRAPRDAWTVRADATQLHQVLMNLCVNARDAMPDGGTLTLELANTELGERETRVHPPASPGPYVVITVTDTGHGIPPSIIDRIFDPFFTTKGVGKGTGLGLPSVMGIVKSHGGFLTVYSEPGRGTSFKVYLPANREAIEARTTPVSAPAPVGHNELILVVDDESQICQAMNLSLSQQGFRVLTAGNGREALDLCKRPGDRVRLVVTDVMMPQMGGVELTKALRELEPGLGIIACTGLDQDSRRAELAALGVTEILTKPFTAEQLFHAVERMLAATGAKPADK